MERERRRLLGGGRRAARSKHTREPLTVSVSFPPYGYRGAGPREVCVDAQRRGKGERGGQGSPAAETKTRGFSVFLRGELKRTVGRAGGGGGRVGDSQSNGDVSRRRSKTASSV